MILLVLSTKQEMQLLLLRYREDIIAAKVSKEHLEETLKSEILFLKDQVSLLMYSILYTNSTLYSYYSYSQR